MSEQLEPVAPSVEFVKHAGDTSGKTADHAAWVKDTEERKARGTAHEAKRRQLSEQASKPIDVVAELDSALTTLEAGAVDFEKSHGQPNSELIESRKLVAELTARLAEEQAKLSAIEARGDSVTRLWNAVSFAEAQLQGLLGTAKTEEVKALASAHYGWDIPFSKVPSDMRKEFALHVSVVSLKRFTIARHPGKTDNVEQLKDRLQLVGSKLVELREHLTEGGLRA